jgi:large conductance mechanosensitive channel
MSMLSEFKDFAYKGNVVQLAIAFVMGVAFGAVTSSLVSDIIMPPLGMVLAGVNFDQIVTTLQEADADGNGLVQIKWGSFLLKVINFLVVAAVMFIIVKMMTTFERKQEEAPAAPPEPSDEVKLLTEIRDALRR